MKYDLYDLATYGHKFIVEPSGASLSEGERRILSELRPAGIIFRSRNFLRNVEYPVWLGAFKELVNDIRSAISRSDLILSIDHEGGRIVRPPAPITRFPYCSKWGEHVSAVAQAMAIELKSLGLNLSYSPVADIHSNPDNPVINQRAFGRTPEEVIPKVLDFMKAFQHFGVTACVKHFPGHGDTASDSHFSLPQIPHDYPFLQLRELRPFKAAVAHGIKFIMTAHVMVPAIDSLSPATFSTPILRGILREHAGFQGVIIADALGMKAVKESMEGYDTAVGALRSGLDLYCVAGDAVDLDCAVRWAKMMQSVILNGDIEASVLEESLGRIERTTAGLPQNEAQVLPGEVLENHAALARTLEAKADWSNFNLNLPGFE